MNKRLNALNDAILRHAGCEVASFHTPGHKGRIRAGGSSLLGDFPWHADLTELPGLDDLSCPQGVLADLEARAADLWRVPASLISVNGASAGLAASMLSLGRRGTCVAVPRNAHRSVIHGLILSGLFPVWYEPVWDDEFGLWGGLSTTAAERLLDRHGKGLAGLVVVSPTYAGALSEVEGIAELCRDRAVPLVVDEAHGAHFLPGSQMPSTAAGHADIVVHSLHKTLPALTQSGLIHIGHHSLISTDEMRQALRLLQSSSPSYLLMASIEQALTELENSGEGVNRLLEWSDCVADAVVRLPALSLYRPGSGIDPAHILIGCGKGQAEDLYEFLCERGIFPETVLGRGVLFMLGIGTTFADVELLCDTLAHFAGDATGDLKPLDSAFSAPRITAVRPPAAEQVLSPRQAFFMPSNVVPAAQAVGMISAETLAPCPPGIPLLVAGQRVPEQILECASLQTIKVVTDFPGSSVEKPAGRDKVPLCPEGGG